jgi:hypothetical protein
MAFYGARVHQRQSVDVASGAGGTAWMITPPLGVHVWLAAAGEGAYGRKLRPNVHEWYDYFLDKIIYGRILWTALNPSFGERGVPLYDRTP